LLFCALPRDGGCLDIGAASLERPDRHNGQCNVGYVDGHVKSQPLNYLLNVNQGTENLPYRIYVAP
jgi:prepilin-type processing-associated H-X9-DG protein